MLQKGLGRALLHVKTYGLDGVDDLVLAACLKRQGYDFQAESSREPWLFQMFVGSNDQPRFRAAILNHLDEETDSDNLQQLCEFAKEMALLGDDEARAFLWIAVQRSAMSQPHDDWAGADVWEELEGNEGILQLARVYGRRLLLNHEDSIPIGVFSIEDQDLKELLEPFAQTDPEIKAYWGYLEEKGQFNVFEPLDRTVAKQQWHERVRSDYSVETIIGNARKKLGEFPGFYTTFGRHATPDELAKIYACFQQEVDEEIRLRLLWVFRRAPLPHLDDVMFHLAEGAHGKLRAAAIAALAQLSDPLIHKLAREKVRKNQMLGDDDEVLDLFSNNYAPDDASLISHSLTSLKPTSDDAHSLGWSVLDLAEKQLDASLSESLKWVYENTPCSNCRERAVKQLYKFNQLDPATLYECQFDCSEDIQAVAKQLIVNS